MPDKSLNLFQGCYHMEAMESGGMVHAGFEPEKPAPIYVISIFAPLGES